MSRDGIESLIMTADDTAEYNAFCDYCDAIAEADIQVAKDAGTNDGEADSESREHLPAFGMRYQPHQFSDNTECRRAYIHAYAAAYRGPIRQSRNVVKLKPIQG